VVESLKERQFNQIIEENKRRIRVFARANTRGDNWRDLEQEIILRIWDGLDRYEGRASIKTWLYGVEINTLNDFKRMLNRPETAVESLELFPASRQSTHSAEESMDAIHILQAFTQSLGDQDRTVLLMHIDGCTYQEISEAVEVDEGALRVRIHRLKKQLAKYAER
jgi:RNA polymerase sigma factor (sigma-70 family)